MCCAFSTFGALQAIAWHTELGSESAEGSSRALDGVNEEQWLFCTIHIVQKCHCGRIWIYQHPTEIRIQQSSRSRMLPLRWLSC